MEIREVFEPVLNFIKHLQKKEKEFASKQAAKDRLKLVLMQDRASVSPDFFEMMKQEIIDVIKKYIEIDEDALEVELTRGLEAGLEGPALYANIPIKNVKPVAPKTENEEEIDELIDNTAPLTEEQADAVAEKILSNIEQSVKNDELKNDVIVSGNSENKSDEFVIAEVAKEISKMRADILASESGKNDKSNGEKNNKTIKKSSTGSKSKKKTSTSRTTGKKTTAKKKKEE